MKNVKFKTKLLIVMLVVGVVPFVLIGIISFKTAGEALQEHIFNALLIEREVKKSEINEYLKNKKREVQLLAEATDVRLLFKKLQQYHDDIRAKPDEPFNIATSRYKRLYDQNIHFFRRFTELFEYRNVFIICAKHGHVTFSVTKANDMGTNLSAGPYKNSNLAQLWRKVVNSASVTMVDFEPYAPSNNEPKSFIGAPILDMEGKVTAVLVTQIDIDTINVAVGRRIGTGKTGETYLVGPDKLMRSDSFLDPVNRSVKASFANPATGSVDTVASRQALAGKSGEKIITKYNGRTVLSAYTPIQVGDFSWALIAEMDYDEAFASINDLKIIIGIVSIIAAGVIIISALLMTRVITKPLTQATSELKSAAEELKVASLQQTSSTTEQATASTKIATTMEELLGSSKQITEATSNAALGVETANQLSVEGKKSLNQAIDGIAQIRTQVQSVTQNMLSLGEKTHQMGSILQIINELADQTTILSYNATIEAAGAGEAGNRFAAVAEQIMNLANKAVESTKEIRILIEDIQKSSNKTVLVTEEGMKAVDEGQQRIENTEGHFAEIIKTSENNLVTSKEIEMTVAQQTTVIEQTSSAVKYVQSAAEEVKTSSAQTLNTAEQLLTMARMLVEI